MVATERIRRAETEEELKEIRLEKEALKSALRVVEGENGRLRTTNITSVMEEAQPAHFVSLDGLPHSSVSRSRSSSRVAVKSRPSSVTSASSIPQSPKATVEVPPSTSAPYPPSPPPEPDLTTTTAIASPALTSSELTPHEASRFPPAAPFIADEQLAWANVKPKPQRLRAESLFPIHTPFSP